MNHKFHRDYFSWSKYLLCWCEWHLREHFSISFPIAIYTFKYLHSNLAHLPMYFFLIYSAFVLVKNRDGFLWRLLHAFWDRWCIFESRSLSAGCRKGLWRIDTLGGKVPVLIKLLQPKQTLSSGKVRERTSQNRAIKAKKSLWLELLFLIPSSWAEIYLS